MERLGHKGLHVGRYNTHYMCITLLKYTTVVHIIIFLLCILIFPAVLINQVILDTTDPFWCKYHIIQTKVFQRYVYKAVDNISLIKLSDQINIYVWNMTFNICFLNNYLLFFIVFPIAISCEYNSKYDKPQRPHHTYLYSSFYFFFKELRN